MIKIIALLGGLSLVGLKLNAQVNASSEMMPFKAEDKSVVDSTIVTGSTLESVSDQKMPFKLMTETEQENKNKFSEEGKSLPEKASEKTSVLPPREE